MALTITEKNHWKERISQRIDKRINQIKCSNPTFFHDISEQAKAEAIKKAKIGKEIARLSEIESTESALNKEKDALLKSTYRILHGKDLDSYYGHKNLIDARIKELQQHEEEDLLRKHELGRDVVSLTSEKESLMDTVWLATSPRQVTDLWQKALKLLGEETTAFQRDVLSGNESSGD